MRPELHQRVRIHEAGHAAVALHLGFSLREVSVGVQGRTAGRVTVESHPSGNQAPLAFWHKAIMASAGVAAELRLFGNVLDIGATEDLKEIELICDALEKVGFRTDAGANTGRAMAAEAQRQAHTLVGELGAEIRAISTELEKQPNLTGNIAAAAFERK